MGNTELKPCQNIEYCGNKITRKETINTPICFPCRIMRRRMAKWTDYEQKIALGLQLDKKL